MIKSWLKSFCAKLSQRPVRRRKQIARRPICVAVESLELRKMLSAGTVSTNVVIPSYEGVTATTLTTNTIGVVTMTPSTMQTAYGVSSLISGGTNGSGETIAIIDAYNDPNIVSDANAFSSYYGLTQFNGTGQPTLTVENQAGLTGTSNLPPTDANADGMGWRIEESLDVEWAHAIAPHANIILIEANSTANADLYAAVSTARNTANVNVVSMSFGDQNSADFFGLAQYDSLFTTPAGHTGGGITFVAATGDDYAASYPALSPNVVAVGGTTLTLSGTGTYSSEIAWGPTGTGASAAEARTATQSLADPNSSTSVGRNAPDVSMDAQNGESPDDYKNGVVVYDSYDGQSSPYYPGIGGTSLAAPMFGAIVALADQQRGSGNSLDGVTQTLPALYQAYTSSTVDHADFNDVGGSYSYSTQTGIGSPIASGLVPTLKNYSPGLSFSGIESSTITDGSGDPAVQLTSAITISDSNSIIGAILGVPDDVGIPSGSSFTSSDTIAFVSGYTLPSGISETQYFAGNASGGELTVSFSGIASAATYQTLLRSLTFTTSSNTVLSTGKRFDFSVTDSTNATSIQSRNMILKNGNPVIVGLQGSSHTAVPYNELGLGMPVDPAGSSFYAQITGNDNFISGAQVVIAANYSSGDVLSFTSPTGSGITGSFSSGTLTLSGIATKADYDTALDSVTFNNVLVSPSTAVRELSFYVTDTSNDTSTATSASFNYVSVSAESTLPTVVESSSGTYTNYYQGGSPVTVTNDLTVTVGNGSSVITSATAQISANYVPGSDLLKMTGSATGVTSSWNPVTGTLTISGSASASTYVTLLDSVQYSSVNVNGLANDNPNNSTPYGIRPITFQVDDGVSWSNLNLNNSIKYVDVNTSTSTPTLTVTGTSSNYSVSGNGLSNPLSIVNSSGTNSIVDSAANSMNELTVTIGNYSSGDVLGFTVNINTLYGLNAVFEYGRLTIWGVASVADYVAVMKDIKFATTTGVSGSYRTFTFQATDDTGAASASNSVTTTLNFVS